MGNPMSVTSDLINQMKTEMAEWHESTEAASTEPTTTETVETPTEEPKPEETLSEEPKPAEEPTEDKPAEPEPSPEPEPTEPKKESKPDLSKLSKEQKAEHAFQRQLSKQKEKHAMEIEELKKSFQSQFDEFKKSMTPKAEPEPLKTRDDFDNDTEFVNYLTMRGVDQRLAERDEQAAKAKAEKEAADKAAAEEQARQQEVANYFNSNARQAFGDDYAAFESRVQKGVANGLADVLDEAPAVRDYIFSNPNGPVLLNELLSNKESFIRVMSRAANPMDAVIECHDLVREIQTRKAPEPTQPKQVMPNLGKPGAGSAPSTAPDMWKDDNELIAFVRRHR